MIITLARVHNVFSVMIKIKHDKIILSIFSEKKQLDVLYLTDADGCILVIKVWDGLKVQSL